MTIHYMLLHGSLGWADELIFVGVGLTFLVLMAIQWMMMRTRDSEPTPPSTDSASEASEEPDRFRLD
jgi:hypothetical protein